MDVDKLIGWHDTHKCASVAGRYVTLDMIKPVLDALPPLFRQQEIGVSATGRVLRSIEVGDGPKRVMCWSQMHGNESTGTKAMLDLLFWLQGESEEVQSIRSKCTFLFLPLLNPDGAVAYTRVNAQGVDLNRDVIEMKAPESKVLQRVLHDFDPQFCFNLHDQRTIFSVGEIPRPATLSFLAPSVDVARTVTAGRMKTMEVIAAIFDGLQALLPGQIGRYSDEFYPTATGDNFEKMGYHTVLIEAGHFVGDYQREVVRKYNFVALVLGIQAIAFPAKNLTYEHYFKIPNNSQFYLDEIHYNVVFQNEAKPMDVGVLYKEKLIDGQVIFDPHLEKIAELSAYNADVKHDVQGEEFKDGADFLNKRRK